MAKQVGTAGLIVAAGTLVSRVLGLGRAILLAYAIGATGLAANAFATSIRIPQTINTLIVAGALTAVLVPQITKAALAKDGGLGYINKLVTLTIVGTASLVPVMAVVTPPLIDVLGGGWNDPAQHSLAIAFAFWLLPQILFYSLYTVVGEVLNARSVFGPYAWAPVVNNVVSIIGLIAFIVFFGPDPDGVRSLGVWSPGAIALVAGSSTLGVALQGLMLFLFWRRAGLRFRFDLRWRGIGLGTMGKVAFWVFLTMLVTQAVGLLNAAVMNIANRPDVAGLAAYELVSLIFVLPHSIITVSIVMVNFTRMSESVHAGNLDQMKTYLTGASRLTIMTMTFFTLLMMLLAVQITRIIFRVTSHDLVLAIALILVFYVACLVPYSLVFVLNRGFFVLSDTRTPFFITLVQSALTVVGALWTATLPDHLITLVLVIILSVLIGLQAVATFLVLRARIGPIGGRSLLRAQAQALVAGIVMTAAGALILWLFGGIDEHAFGVATVWGAIVVTAVVTIVTGIVYVAVLAALKNPELRVLRSRVEARLRRN